jgi:hypothetical protein
MTTTEQIKYILESSPRALTTDEILDRSDFNNRDTLAAQLSNLRKAGEIENGISEIIDGKTRLTWMLPKPTTTGTGTALKDALHAQPVTLDPTDPVESLIGQSILKYRETKQQLPVLPDLDETIRALGFLTPILADTYKQRIETLISIINNNGANPCN